MRTSKKFAVVACLVFLTANAALAQSEAQKPKYFHLEFTVQEMENAKIANARSYSLVVSTDKNFPGSIRTGSRVPFEASPGQIQFLEVGVNIDCRLVQDLDGMIGLNITAEISGLADVTAGKPVMRQTKWSSNVVVPARKATVLFSADDVSTKRRLQLELTATPVK